MFQSKSTPLFFTSSNKCSKLCQFGFDIWHWESPSGHHQISVVRPSCDAVIIGSLSIDYRNEMADISTSVLYPSKLNTHSHKHTTSSQHSAVIKYGFMTEVQLRVSFHVDGGLFAIESNDDAMWGHFVVWRVVRMSDERKTWRYTYIQYTYTHTLTHGRRFHAHCSRSTCPLITVRRERAAAHRHTTTPAALYLLILSVATVLLPWLCKSCSCVSWTSAPYAHKVRAPVAPPS